MPHHIMPSSTSQGRRKGRGGKRPTVRQDSTQLDTPSDSPKRKDSKLEFQGRLSHASPRVTDSLITQFFRPENNVEVKVSAPAATPKLSGSPKSLLPAFAETDVEEVVSEVVADIVAIHNTSPSDLQKDSSPAPEVITLSDDESEVPRTATPHKMIYDPPKVSPTNALAQLNLVNGTGKKGVKSCRRLNPSQSQNQMTPAVTKLGCCNKPKVPTTNTASQAKSERPEVNHKLTEYFPVRRSVRKTKKTVLEERQRSLEEAVLANKEEGLEIHNFEGKGRGVVTTRAFQRGEFVVEYAGELIKMDEAREREKLYAQDQNTGCYMYYFKHRNYQYCVDATAETDRLGRLVNHSRNGNLTTKTILLNNCPRLVLVAKEDIPPGDEVTYDYGDRSKESLRYHPWLAN